MASQALTEIMKGAHGILGRERYVVSNAKVKLNFRHL